MTSFSNCSNQQLTIFEDYLPEEEGFGLHYLDIPQDLWGNEIDFLNDLLKDLSIKEKQEIILFFQDLYSDKIIISERLLKNIARNRLTKEYMNSLTFPAKTQKESNSLRRAYFTHLDAIFVVLVARHILLREGAMEIILSSDVFQQRFDAFLADIRRGDEAHDTVENFKKFMLPLLALEIKGITSGFYNRNDGLILEVCTIYENSGKKYVTGGGPSQATKRRQAARDLITGNLRAERASKKRKLPSSSHISASSDKKKKVTKKQDKGVKSKSLQNKKQKVNHFCFTYHLFNNSVDSEGSNSDDDSFSPPTVSSLCSPDLSVDEEGTSQNKTFSFPRTNSLDLSFLVDDIFDTSKESFLDESCSVTF
jgi:hypothetical protein